MLNRLKIQLTGSLLCLSLQMMVGQTFENSIGDPAKNEYTYDGKPLPVPKGFATVSNSPVFSTNNQWLFTRLKPNGDPTLNKVYGESNDIIKNFLEGRAIERAAGDSKLLYQAGARTHAKPVRAVLMLSNSSGTPLHALQQYSPDNSGEMATALESTPDGVIVAGNAQYKKLQTINNRFFAARFKLSNNKLTKIWSFRYFDGDSLKANFTIGKTCLGTVNGKPVLLITGSYQKNGRHSFVSCIDAGNGAELWRTYVESSFPTDEGADIIQDLATRNFMMVGYCINTAGRRCLYVAFLNEAGVFLTSASYATVFGNSEIVGQDVTLSNDQKSGVITGYVRLPENNLQPKAFFVEIPLALPPGGGGPASPTQIKYYTASGPFIKGTSSIDRNDNANNTRGYFIATQSTARNGRLVNYDIHVIDVENDGETRLQSCPVKKFELRQEPRGRGRKARMVKEPTNWDDIKIIEKAIDLPIKRCD